MLVHESQMDRVVPYLVDEVGKYRLGDPRNRETTMGPVVNVAQFETYQRYIQIGMDEGARVVMRGPWPPRGLEQGYFTQPTVFVDVTPDMTIAQEEIFGPVLAVMPYSRPRTRRFRSPMIQSLWPRRLCFRSRPQEGLRIRQRLARGRVSFNGAATNSLTPMGGYKQSGIGRSMGELRARRVPRGQIRLRVRARSSGTADLSADITPIDQETTRT